jgi:L-lactate dehydrogenase
MIHDYYGLDGICFSLPTVIDRGGVEKVIKLKLDANELEGLKNSATVLKDTIRKLDL